ncbi:uncharacterized protein JCM15063_003577 [Sporobolomyces koalae]|uniref:uncharacterized protein n=1 Tax=Sporobolomyces koalae TaxID=500713 RepID=UPI003179B57B
MKAIELSNGETRVISPLSTAVTMVDSLSDKAQPQPAGTNETDERPRQHKRTRAAMDPGTPRGEDGEPKGLASSTPAAKKGRVQDDESPRDESRGSPPSDADVDTARTTTPPPSSSTAEPSTPAHPDGSTSNLPQPPRTEGKETRHIRERVAAMKPPGQNPDDSATAREPAQGPTPPETTQDKDMQAADTAAQVATTAAKLGDEQEQKQEQDTEIAEVAAEVGKSAELVNEKEPVKLEGEAKVAAEVDESAAKVQAEDAEIAETAAETAQVAKAVPETKPAPSTSFVPYTGGSSSFSSFSSSSSPFASVSTPAKPAPPPPADAQKPKTKTSFSASSFSASPFLASSVPLAKRADVPTGASALGTSASTSTSSSSAATLAPSTPASKPLSANSPFSAFASTSGFASASKPSTAGGATPSAFSSYSMKSSAFASVPSTPSAKNPLPASALGSKDSNHSASEPSSSNEEAGTTAPARKIGEPEQPDENKRVFTEQETHTGEEEDQVVHNVRAKLFAMHDGNWVERGMGPLKVNLTKRTGEKEGARIVMRADATHRLLLNSPLFKEFFIEVSNEKYVRFTIIEGSEPISYMARLGNPAAAEALVAAIRERTSAL